MCSIQIQVNKEDYQTYIEMLRQWRLDKKDATLSADMSTGCILLNAGNGELSVWWIKDWKVNRASFIQDSWFSYNETDYKTLLVNNAGIRENFQFTDGATNAYFVTKFNLMFSSLIRKQLEDIPF